MAEFTATARIPCRPLSTENKDLAVPKELLVDYENGSVWVCKADGSFVDISSTIKEIVVKEIGENPDTLLKEIQIEIEGDIYNLETIMINNTVDIEEIKKALGYEIDPETGEVNLTIINQIENILKELGYVDPNTGEVDMSVLEKAALATHPEFLKATIIGGTAAWSGSAAPYTQKVDVADILESDTPIVDISLGDVYETVQKQLDSYAYIYKILTYDGFIMVYASQPTETDVTINIRIDR